MLKNTVDFFVPIGCRYYPGDPGIARVVKYQTVLLYESDRECYVAAEAKVLKYSHIVHFASFVLDNGSAVTGVTGGTGVPFAHPVSTETRLICYEYNDDDPRVDYRPTLPVEVANILVPSGFEIGQTMSSHTLRNPADIFTFAFCGEGRRSTIQFNDSLNTARCN